MSSELPYIAEYAKSGRASCKICKESIPKDGLRIGVMVQSHNFDSKIPLWHHARCYLKKKKIPDPSEIANFDNLRFEDQKKITDAGNVKQKNGESVEADNADFSIEYAKSSRAECKGCEEKIQKGEIRISKVVTDTPDARRYGPIPAWRHLDCFVNDRLELNFSDSADRIPGFKKLEEEDKKMVLSKLPGLKVKRKAEDDQEDTVKDNPPKKLRKEDRVLKIQSDLLFDMLKKIKEKLSKKEIIQLLEHNKQHISVGEQQLQYNLADCLIFGAIKICPVCKSDAPRFKFDQYRCSGNMTEWTQCQYVTKCPERQPFEIPEEFKEKYDFLQDYKYIKRDRFIPARDEAKPASAIRKGPLNGYIIAFFGKFNSSKSSMERKVMNLGGAVSSKLDKSVSCCISTEDEINNPKSKANQAKDHDINVVSPKFLEDVEKGTPPPAAMKENKISPWGEDPILKFGIKQEKNSASTSKDKDTISSAYAKSNSSQKIKIKVQGGAAVDPESGMEDKTHVYKYKNDIYSVVLGKVDVVKGSNNFYKLQILESDKGKSYWLFRSWGRIGTTIGNKLLEKKDSLVDAISTFESLYKEKTGNLWINHNKFEKKPGLMYPLDIDYGQENEQLQELKPCEDSKLPKPVQELICLIFDIQAMKKAMLEFEIDLQKMPLGKLSKKQIELAFKVIIEAQEILNTGSNPTKILDVSNRFYTLIPHDFGMKSPPLLDNEDLIKSKIEMLDSLLEIEFAYNMLKGDGTSTQDPVEEHYKKLCTDIEVLDKKSTEFEVIQTYMKNTHADTHKMYDLKLQEVFKINRHGENERYQKFKDLHNKKLLWHGSRLTNFVGILSQGLRIAPPEAPCTGYMFGKGIYFADMVSKSANYCYSNKKNPTGLLLLCEVALGNMCEKKYADFVTKLPKNIHSVKGVGATVPNPEDKTFLGDVEVPYGKPKTLNSSGALLYNEYIVYDVNQVNIKYLLKVNFKWKY